MQYIKVNIKRYVIVNTVFAFIGYNLLLNINSARPGAVDKVEGAFYTTGILLLLLNASFFITFLISRLFKKKLPLVVLIGIETLIFLGLFSISILITQ